MFIASLCIDEILNIYALSGVRYLITPLCSKLHRIFILCNKSHQLNNIFPPTYPLAIYLSTGYPHITLVLYYKQYINQ